MVEQWPPKPPVGGSNPSALVKVSFRAGNSLMKQQNHRGTLSKKISIAKKQAASAGNFLEEIKKIEWVGKQDLRRYVKIVIMSIFGFGFSVYCVDLIFRKALGLLGNIVGFFFG